GILNRRTRMGASSPNTAKLTAAARMPGRSSWKLCEILSKSCHRALGQASSRSVRGVACQPAARPHRGLVYWREHAGLSGRPRFAWGCRFARRTGRDAGALLRMNQLQHALGFDEAAVELQSTHEVFTGELRLLLLVQQEADVVMRDGRRMHGQQMLERVLRLIELDEHLREIVAVERFLRSQTRGVFQLASRLVKAPLSREA